MRPLCFTLALLRFALSFGVLAACTGSDDHVDRMAEEHEHDAPTGSPAVAGADSLDVTAAEVVYDTLGGHPVTGYLARPSSADPATPLPGLIVIHEWWGLNDHIRAMTRRLANEGYAALAIDLYGGQTADTPDAARTLMERTLPQGEALMGSVASALAFLRLQQRAPRVGVIGWCFGGGWALETALSHPGQVDAAVMYYGRVVTDGDRLAMLDAPLLGHFGEADQGIPVADVRQMEQRLRDLRKPAEIHVYEGADHAFANPSGGNYHEDAAEASWRRTVAFLSTHLGVGRG
ncbi:MAG TPA: dienelactone hydrolase family protein [Rubricoccaceae bacterium]|nr:dienelactone hydrolase family protein [Rubricoccaceae bacterium]